MKKTICIYHANCFDGICAAWVVSKFYPKADFRPMSYADNITNIIPELESENLRIIFVDFSLKREELLDLVALGHNVLVLDHHKTAQKELEGLSFCKFNMNESGASLAWEYFELQRIEMPGDLPLPQPNLVRYIKDRDLWLFNEPDSETINSYIQSFDMTIENYDYLNNKLSSVNGLGEAKISGEAILRYKQTMIKAMCKNAKMRSFGDFIVPVVNASILFSEVGNELCKIYPEAPFAAYYFDNLAKGVIQWGLRSIGDFDVSEVAKLYGGGGHKNAAGFTTHNMRILI